MITKTAVRWLDRQIRSGSLRVEFDDGTTWQLGRAGTTPTADITVASQSALSSILRGGSMSLTEAYMEGRLDAPDLRAFLSLAAENQQLWAAAHPRLYALGRTLSARWSSNSHRHVDTMAGHYNLGNDFYAAWLDPSMTYSSARFLSPEMTLEEAQHAKYDSIARMADLAPGMRVLEIGTGWGGFALEAAARGCHVTTLTISEEQQLWVKKRISAEGLEGRIDAQLLDYRHISGRYDRVVSIEMIESIDHLRWPEYFETIARVLEPGGIAVLQAIVIDDSFYDTYVDNEDFIRRYIFPGGMLPSPKVIGDLSSRVGLKLDRVESFGADYARTLQTWHRNFEDAWPSIAAMGFDDRFRRMWKAYLAYCQVGFEIGRLDVRQLGFVHDH